MSAEAAAQTPPDDDRNLSAVPDPEPAELAVEADGQLGMKVGGRKPDSAVLKLKGAKIDLGEGQFNRGDRITTVVTLQVVGDNDQDTIDRLSGEVKSTSKAQSATVCGIATLEAWLNAQVSDEKLVAAVLKATEGS